MTWAEFQIRLQGYKRGENARFEMLRELMWVTYVAPHLDPKKIAKTKQSFMPLPIDKKKRKGVGELQKQNFIKVFEQWQKERN